MRQAEQGGFITNHAQQKSRDPFFDEGSRLLAAPEGTNQWWRWAELNRRPKALHPQLYMLSSPLDFVPEQHGVRSTSRNKPAVF